MSYIDYLKVIKIYKITQKILKKNLWSLKMLFWSKLFSSLHAFAYKNNTIYSFFVKKKKLEVFLAAAFVSTTKHKKQ